MTKGEYVALANSNGEYQLTETPIVRCRDCRTRHYNPLCGHICDNFGFTIPDDNIDGFCSWGERKNDE